MNLIASPDQITSDELNDLWTQSRRLFNDAAARFGEHAVNCEIADVSLRLTYSCASTHALFEQALKGIVCESEAQAAQAHLFVVDCMTCGVPMPQVQRPIRHLILRRGDCVQDEHARVKVFFSAADATLSVFNREENTCIVFLNDSKQLPSWATAAPFRLAFALLLQAKQVQIVHGAAVGSPDGAVLITGYGGSGKSTSALSCFRAGLGLLGDDYVAIRRAANRPSEPLVCNLYSSLKVVRTELRDEITHGSWGNKSILLPLNDAPDRLIKNAPLIGVFHAKIIASNTTRLTPCPVSEVARIACASTLIQIPICHQTTEKIITECFAEAKRSHRLELGRIRDDAPSVIKKFLAQENPTDQKPTRILNRAPTQIPTTNTAGYLPMSVIVPVHNGAQYILESINSILHQDYPDCEIIIVDDGSTDNLLDTLANTDFPIRLIQQPKQGPAAARNTGLRNIKRPWIAFLDADDIWPPNRLNLMAYDMLIHPEAMVVQGSVLTFVDGPEKKRVNAVHPRQNFEFFISAALFRRKAFDTVGLFNETLKSNEDTEWFIRAARHKKTIRIPEETLYARTHPDSLTEKNTTNHTGVLIGVKSLLRQKRQAQ